MSFNTRELSKIFHLSITYYLIALIILFFLIDRRALHLRQIYYKGAIFISSDYKDTNAGILYFDLAAKYYPAEAYNFEELGNLYYKINEYDEAVTNYRKASMLKPENERYKLLLTGAYLAKNEKTKALSIAQQILSDSQDAEILVNFGSLFAESKFSEVALTLFLKGLQVDPQNVSAHIEMGKLYGNLGQFDKAIAVWQEGLNIDPEKKEFEQLIEQAQALKASQ